VKSASGLGPRAPGQNPFDPSCRDCPRLAAFLDEVAVANPGYFCKPVPSFGDSQARLLIVGLAPGMHGANATGRPFTGDFAGVLLYETLHELGLGSAAESISADDGLTLSGCRITNAVRCLPPQNKPTTDEVKRCNTYLAHELASVPQGGVVLALGKIAHDAVLRACGMKISALKFGHGAEHELPRDQGRGATLVDSYHCSRYNQNTKRLTVAMFREVMERAAGLAGLTPHAARRTTGTSPDLA
jgi:uracil-DNA glycosylase family 4